jgi:radical SAM protein with 4Fe4S-binding SPASM domain
MNRRVVADRGGVARRAARFLRRDDLTVPEKVDSFRNGLRAKLATRASRGLESSCLIGWHSMVIRTTGTVAPCCILQGKELGNIYRQSVREVWHGEPYARFRAELVRILREGAAWQHDEAADRTVDALCGMKGGCPVGTFYYKPDIPFLRSFNRLLG